MITIERPDVRTALQTFGSENGLLDKLFASLLLKTVADDDNYQVDDEDRISDLIEATITTMKAQRFIVNELPNYAEIVGIILLAVLTRKVKNIKKTPVKRRTGQDKKFVDRWKHLGGKDKVSLEYQRNKLLTDPKYVNDKDGLKKALKQLEDSFGAKLDNTITGSVYAASLGATAWDLFDKIDQAWNFPLSEQIFKTLNGITKEATVTSTRVSLDADTAELLRSFKCSSSPVGCEIADLTITPPLYVLGYLELARRSSRMQAVPSWIKEMPLNSRTMIQSNLSDKNAALRHEKDIATRLNVAFNRIHNEVIRDTSLPDLTTGAALLAIFTGARFKTLKLALGMGVNSVAREKGK